MPRHRRAINDHRRITSDDDRGAMPFLRAGDLITYTSQAFAMRVGGHGRPNHNATMISAISEDDERPHFKLPFIFGQECSSGKSSG